MQLDAQAIAGALASGALEVHYQPVVVLPDQHVVGFEALARLRLPSGELIPPNRFISVAERSGLIVPLGRAVLRTAIAEAARWRAGTSLLATATVSVNVAPPQLECPDFFDVVTEVLSEHDVPGSALILEITESVATSAEVRPLLEQLSALGIRIALDDFGIGFATLDNLRRLPVQVLKLDRSFVAGVTKAGIDRAIVRVVIDLADTLGLSVIAEGVETREQADALFRLGCPAAQGFLFAPGRAVPEEAAAAVQAAGHLVSPGRRREVDIWEADVDTGVLAAVRLLACGPDRRRAAVHAVATEAARLLKHTEQGVRTAGRLALVHDLHRLAIDGVLPGRLAKVAPLAALGSALGAAGAVGAAELPEWPELDLVRAAEAAVVAAERLCSPRRDSRHGVPEWGEREALVAGLRWVAEQRAAADPLGMAFEVMAKTPPDVVPLADLIDDLDRRRLGRRGMEDRLRSLVGITRVLASSRDTRELMRVALEEVRRIVGAASASLERWDRDTGVLRTLVNVGQLGPGETTFPEDETYPISEYFQATRTTSTGLPYLHTIDDPEAAPEAVALLKSLHKYSSAAVPVYLEGRMWGQLWLATGVGEPPFAASDIETLTAVATLMGGVIVQAENLDRVARLAFEDPLTRVGNRRAIDDVLERLSAAEDAAAVILIDVDLLKQLNDTQGHARGDQALIDVAEALSRAASSWPGATVGRLGGDEFCVVIPDADRDDGVTLVAMLRRLLAETGRGPDVSVGVAATTAPWTPREALVRADEELYVAKRSSRSRGASRRSVAAASGSGSVSGRAGPTLTSSVVSG